MDQRIADELGVTGRLTAIGRILDGILGLAGLS